MDYLLPYQKRWVENDSDFSIYVKARRIGITFAEACWSVRRRLTHKLDHWFVSRDSATAVEFIRTCKLWAEVLNVAVQGELIETGKASSECLTFPNGSRIMALSRDPSAVRGKGGDITIDEFAFHEQAEELYTAAQPVRQWGGVMRLISTENGPATIFHRLVEQARVGKNDFKFYQTTLPEAVAQGLAERVPGAHQSLPPEQRDTAFVEAIRRTCWSEAAYGQEYLCEVNSLETVIDPGEFNLCILPSFRVGDEIPKDKLGPLYIGIDIGRSKNRSVIWVLEQGLDPKAPPHLQICYRTVAIKEMIDTPFRAQFEIMDRYIGHPNVHRAAIDMGGIGMQLSEELYSKYGDRVEKISIGHVCKARLVERTKSYVASQRVSLPDDEITRADLTSMRRVVTRSGTFTYDGTSGDSHCDRFIALALALEAADGSFRLSAFTNQGKEDDQRPADGPVLATI